jgi:hypothetical protein
LVSSPTADDQSKEADQEEHEQNFYERHDDRLWRMQGGRGEADDDY